MEEWRGRRGANSRVTYFWKGNRPLVWHVCAISKINSAGWNSAFRSFFFFFFLLLAKVL